MVAVAIAASSLAQPLTAGVYDFATTDEGITYNGGATSLAQLIMDNTRAGVGYAIQFGDSGVNIGSVSVTINTSGGYNGDLYAYVSHGGTLVQLLDPNLAVSGSGLNITLAETGSPLPTGGSGVLTGSYMSFGNLSAFNGMSATGEWTVFFADLNAGDVSTLTGFNIYVQAVAVPEPSSLALGGLVLGLAGIGAMRRYYQAQKTAAASQQLID